MAGDTFQEMSLDEIANFRNGKAISPERYSERGRIPVFGANGQIARSDDVLNPEAVVAIGRVGAYCGSVHYIPEPSWVTDNAIVATAKPRNDIRFLYYLLNRLDLRRIAIGSAHPLMTQGGLKVVRTIVPPLKEQQAIACILGALDDKIELNRKINKTLEEMARAIFKSWFVDFDPVRVKAAGQHPPGLKPEIAALFPDSFQDSELGRIPKGWKVGTLGNIAHEVRDGASPSEIAPETPYIALEHIPKRCIAIDSWGIADGVASGKLRFRRGDILFGKLRPYFHKVGPAPIDGVCSTDIVVTRPQSECWYGLVAGHMTDDAFVAHTDRSSSGTKMPRTNWRDMAAYAIAVPSVDLAKRHTQVVLPMLGKMHEGIMQSRTLAALRDALLPKLISGELAVQDAERIVERSV